MKKQKKQSLKQQQKQKEKEEEYFLKMLDTIKEDIHLKRHKTSSYNSNICGRLSAERFDELLATNNLKYEFE